MATQTSTILSTKAIVNYYWYPLNGDISMTIFKYIIIVRLFSISIEESKFTRKSLM